MRIKIIGGGLAGCEAALLCARFGVAADLYEMRPVQTTPAHQTGDFGELVCSNSLKSESENTAPWLLKQEMRRVGSRLLQCADAAAVPAGHALAVDRIAFSQGIAEAITRDPLIKVHREEVTKIDEHDGLTIVASGPLTSTALSQEIARLTGSDHLSFYDSISPIVEADSIDDSRVYRAARYDKGDADYINCPFTKEEYDRFYDALMEAQSVEGKDWEKLNYFEGCLPIEEIARRGRDTLRFGPMKPVGLKDPRTGKMPYAVVQLRQENQRADSYNLVGFQNHLKYGEQARVLKLIPGLENARFLRYGQIHRNTYIHAPSLLRGSLQMKAHPRVLFAGQICGVEGYVESIATGMLAGIYAVMMSTGSLSQNQFGNEDTAKPQGLKPNGSEQLAARLKSCPDTSSRRDASEEPIESLMLIPRTTALGSLTHYITHADAKRFQPANITFDLLPQLEEKIRDRKLRHQRICERALSEFDAWWKQILRQLQPVAPGIET